MKSNDLFSQSGSILSTIILRSSRKWIPDNILQVVPRASAVIPGYTSIGIHSDHEGMTKFEEINDPGFLGVAHVLLQWTKDLQSNLGIWPNCPQG